MLELVGLGTDQQAGAAVAADLGGTFYVNHPGEKDTRPYSFLLRTSTDRLEPLAEAADVGLYVVFARTIKPRPDPPPPDRVIGTFGMISHPDLGHRRSDDHWRDVHAPLALASHRAMCDYTQLSVVATLSGMPLDGIAMCAFATREDLSTKFFNDDAARAAVEADVTSFADVRASPRRVVLVQQDQG